MLEQTLISFVTSNQEELKIGAVEDEKLRDVINKVYKETGWTLVAFKEQDGFTVYK